MKEKFHSALFNEVKGSLFEYLCAQVLARHYRVEADFLKHLPEHYQRVLEQQDHLTSVHFPEHLERLPRWAQQVAETLKEKLKDTPVKSIKLTGQYMNHAEETQFAEADFFIDSRPVSLKLNKRQGAVNTKSGGIKSFFTSYFTHPEAAALQESFNQLVESEFAILRFELHELAALPDDDWKSWRKASLSELPGELPRPMRERLHQFYAKLANRLTENLKRLQALDAASFNDALIRLCGLSRPDLWQVVCFHDPSGGAEVIFHDEAKVRRKLQNIQWRESSEIASCELEISDWMLQIRIKPMNKFTTTAIKMNCSVRF